MNNKLFITKYSKAFCEVLEIIKYLPKEIGNLIPKEKIAVFEVYKDRNYYFKYDKNKSLKDQNILKETKTIMGYLYEDFIKNFY